MEVFPTASFPSDTCGFGCEDSFRASNPRNSLAFAIFSSRTETSPLPWFPQRSQ